MRILCTTVATAAVHLDGELLKRAGPGEGRGREGEAGGDATLQTLLVQVWFADDGGDTLEDAAYAGRFAIGAKLWPSKSMKRRRPRVRSARDVQAEVMFVFHRQPAPKSTSADESAAAQVASATEHGTNIEPLEFRRLFREVVFRAQVEYSSDKTLRGQRVYGVVVQDRHRLTFSTSGNPSSVEDSMDTREANVPRKRRSRKKKASNASSSSSSKVLARSTPLDLSKTNFSASNCTSGSSSESNPLVVPVLEQEHVHNVYETIADHWDGTRYAPWPRVVEFIQSLPASSLIADVGCGNGKYMQSTYIGRPVALGRAFVGCDMSRSLVSICTGRGFNALVCDGLLLPYRNSAFDAAISIAVFHHISTHKRRLRALHELARVVRVGGPILIYAWAQEQGDESRRRFESQDVLVPWHLKKNKASAVGSSARKKKKAGAPPGKTAENQGRESKRARLEGGGCEATHSSENSRADSQSDNTTDQKHKIFQRYCHVYRKGDLEALVEEVPNLKVLRSYFDCSNWAIVVERI
eukprot:g3048.t1